MPTERQLLIRTLKSLGYIGDLRQGKLSDLKEFIQRYNHANKLGFNHAQWDNQSLHQYMSNKRQQLHRRLKSAFTAIRFLIKLKPTTNLLSAVCISSSTNMLKNKFCSAYFTGVIPLLFQN
ncbi:hypothetical protein PROFUN_13395 [Planoprotostelium fungivorum]|uniref:Uncharacterized protein n=1 Tax=Planoprotostelium fungivorum TaxID=1890364 RepID=A0A2P6N3Q3_9EUKA|nr:hypothetical protein PROFUN_13395 [Planoprotostelium fungivorum]